MSGAPQRRSGDRCCERYLRLWTWVLWGVSLTPEAGGAASAVRSMHVCMRSCFRSERMQGINRLALVSWVGLVGVTASLSPEVRVVRCMSRRPAEQAEVESEESDDGHIERLSRTIGLLNAGVAVRCACDGMSLVPATLADGGCIHGRRVTPSD